MWDSITHCLIIDHPVGYNLICYANYREAKMFNKKLLGLGVIFCVVTSQINAASPSIKVLGLSLQKTKPGSITQTYSFGSPGTQLLLEVPLPVNSYLDNQVAISFFGDNTHKNLIKAGQAKLQNAEDQASSFSGYYNGVNLQKIQYNDSDGVLYLPLSALALPASKATYLILKASIVFYGPNKKEAVKTVTVKFLFPAKGAPYQNESVKIGNQKVVYVNNGLSYGMGKGDQAFKFKTNSFKHASLFINKVETYDSSGELTHTTNYPLSGKNFMVPYARASNQSKKLITGTFKIYYQLHPAKTMVPVNLKIGLGLQAIKNH
ncbi:MAG: hypothetical protein COB66_01055 [Coxiella sp. (in: Bacteria)]|nr:MAG: hypothetical protein COB66_01055 [Coxiella sp. (in: g-proteobacteria)]